VPPTPYQTGYRSLRHRNRYVIELKGVFDLRLRLIVPLAAIAALLVSSVAVASSQSSSVVKPIKITATLKDYSIHFSRVSVPKGSTVLFSI
jgi:hypothetical protein